jgi:CheY-like chemotaxis protein
MSDQEQVRVLVVDDEVVIRTTLDMILRRVGYTVTMAANGEEALDLLV